VAKRLQRGKECLDDFGFGLEFVDEVFNVLYFDTCLAHFRLSNGKDPFVSGAMFVLGILTAGFSLFSTRKLKNILRTRFKL